MKRGRERVRKGASLKEGRERERGSLMRKVCEREKRAVTIAI